MAEEFRLLPGFVKVIITSRPTTPGGQKLTSLFRCGVWAVGCGGDVCGGGQQANDTWRAEAHLFIPVGPVTLAGIDYENYLCPYLCPYLFSGIGSLIPLSQRPPKIWMT